MDMRVKRISITWDEKIGPPLGPAWLVRVYWMGESGARAFYFSKDFYSKRAPDGLLIEAAIASLSQTWGIHPDDIRGARFEVER